MSLIRVNLEPKSGVEPSVLSLKFVKQVVHELAVIPAEAGIQMHWKSWIPGRASFRQLARNDDRIMLRTSEQANRLLKKAHTPIALSTVEGCAEIASNQRTGLARG